MSESEAQRSEIAARARARGETDDANEDATWISAALHALEPFIAKAKSPDDIAKLMLEMRVRCQGGAFRRELSFEIMELTHRLRGNAWATTAYSIYNQDIARLEIERDGTFPEGPAPHLDGTPINIEYIGNGDDG